MGFRRLIGGKRKCCSCGNLYPLTSEYFHKASKNWAGFRHKCKKCANRDSPKSTRIIDKENKRCPECGQLFPATLEFFYKNNQKKHGLSCYCKKCKDLKNTDWQKRNPEKVKEFHEKAMEKIKTTRYEEVLEYHRKWNNDKYKNDLEYHIERVLRERMKNSLKGKLKSDTTLALLGCSTNFFISHLESKFKEGMSWSNYGNGEGTWNIDHVIPCAKFILSIMEQQKECFHWSNLQPMWQNENRSKGSLYNGIRYKKVMQEELV